ncbi:hypothetical protein HZA99_04130 [Candidatus Woesearchaeota archaeon]|nr:hypothetical protein [Candidatus Woesearchaeota archaeon]
MSIDPTIILIKRAELIKSIAEQHKNNSLYFLDGAKTMLNSNTPLLAVLLGYFAMEHKANQLLALNGYKVESHICTQLGLSRLLKKKELARKISEVFQERQTIGYRMFLKQSEEEQRHAKKIIEENIIPFIQEIDALIKLETMKL